MRLTTFATAYALLGTAWAVKAARFEACNGHRELCGRPYTDMTFIGAHDSPFVGDSIADNQNISIPAQLAMGVRFLQGQTHSSENGTIELCHSDCAIRDAGPLRSMLAPVKTFLDANPTEVLTLLLTNHGGLPGTAFDRVFREVGLEPYALAMSGTSTLEQWPTLGEMVVSGKRLVVFMGLFLGSCRVDCRTARYLTILCSPRLSENAICAVHP